MIFPLGETASAIRGENELWLAMVLRSKILLDLKPAQLAAVCGSIVSEGIKVRPSKNNRLQLPIGIMSILFSFCLLIFNRSLKNFSSYLQLHL